MKRAFPQKVKSVPSCVTETEEVPSSQKLSLPESNRRVRTSAAMIGLAISMGAHSLLLSRPGDKAVAAEPIASEATAAAASESAATAGSAAIDVAALATNAEAGSSSSATSSLGGTAIEHTVQEGQTLWQLAQLYGVDTATVANANGLPVNAVLHVGQVLKIPASSRVALAAQAESDVQVSAEYYGPVTGTPLQAPAAPSSGSDAELRAKQNSALSNLQQKRDSLRLSLTQLKQAKQDASAPVVESVVVPIAQEAPSAGLQSKVDEGQSSSQPIPQQSNHLVPTSSVSYRVESGDTLSAIAKTYGISQRQLADANGLANPNKIRASQVLVIPQSRSASIGGPSPNSVIVASEPVSEPVSARSVPVVGGTSHQVASPTAGITAGNPLRSLPSPQSSTNAPSLQAQIASSENDVTVAASPFAAARPSQSEQSESKLHHSYVENLRVEIVKLREKYKTTPSVSKVESQPATRVAAALRDRSTDVPASDRVNPEFDSSAYTEALRAQVRSLKTKPQAQPVKPSTDAAAPERSISKSKPQLVATAPLGSESYEPLIPSSLGQMVSPDLPPLGSVDAYLPGNAGKFKGYVWPAKGVLTSGYGWRWGRMHKGIDIAAPIGTPIVASAAGVVSYAGWNSGGYGNLVEITHPDGSVTLYAHNNRILVRSGQQVEQGQQIAEMGSTGYSTGSHSHFEVHLPGQGAVNPMAHLPRAGA